MRRAHILICSTSACLRLADASHWQSRAERNVYEVLNRNVARIRLFREEADYAAWERVIERSLPLAGALARQCRFRLSRRET
jgi:hypothetical protein